MKGKSLLQRLAFAASGVAHALKHESSFRVQVAMAVAVLMTAVFLKPPVVWLALLIVMVVLVLSAELFNTAIEAMLDGLHPESAAFVRAAKDCAAGAVLLLSIGAILVFGLMLWAVC